MSEMSKKARAALREKAKRLSTEKDMKVDSSNWTPAEPLEAQAKTGMRPVSRRAFKKGGKVTGAESVKHAGRKARKAGGRLVAEDKTEAKDIAIAKMNRNQKEANQSREGIKHIGGLKRGGRAACNVGGAPTGVLKKAIGSMMTGGMKKGGNVKRKGHSNGERVDEIGEMIRAMPATDNTPAANSAVMPQRSPTLPVEEVSPADAARMRAIMNRSTRENMQAERDEKARQLFKLRGFKKGGKAKARKAGGQVMHYGPSEENEGEDLPKDLSGQKKLENDAAKRSKPTRGKAQNYANGGMPDSRMAIVKPRMFDFGAGTSGSPYKKGGAAKHEDEAMDKALIKKMVKPEARKRPGKFYGGAMGGNAPQMIPPALQQGMQPPAPMPDMAAGMQPQAAMPNMAATNPAGYARGGKTKGKGKTNINIVIAAGQKPQDAGMMPPPPPGGPGGPPAGGGIPVPMSAGPGAPPAPMPMPMPMPMPAGAPPMARKSGGRTNKAFGGGKMQPGAAAMPVPQRAAAPMPVPQRSAPPQMVGGRGKALPPADMARPPMPMRRKDGGRLSKVASSYKDMTAGAGSGEGRLQKTDIAKRGERKAGGGVYRSYKDMDAGAGSGLGRLEKTEIQKRK